MNASIYTATHTPMGSRRGKDVREYGTRAHWHADLRPTLTRRQLSDLLATVDDDDPRLDALADRLADLVADHRSIVAEHDDTAPSDVTRDAVRQVEAAAARLADRLTRHAGILDDAASDPRDPLVGAIPLWRRVRRDVVDVQRICEAILARPPATGGHPNVTDRRLALADALLDVLAETALAVTAEDAIDLYALVARLAGDPVSATFRKNVLSPHVRGRLRSEEPPKDGG